MALSESKMAPNRPSSARPDEFVISRVFEAPRELVWQAFTQCEHLMQWWGPKGFKMLSCNLDLRPGGVFHYALQSPDGQTMWGKFIYCEIVAPERLVHIVSFSDERQGVSRHPMSPSWPLQTLATGTFDAHGGNTKLTVRWAPHEATQEERNTFAASHEDMQQGWTGTMDQLAAYLAQVRAGQTKRQ
jgi:uncharacterized protein YndB with AHSA1/START domain